MRGTVDADDVEDGGIAPADSGGARIARSGSGTRRSRRAGHAGPEGACRKPSGSWKPPGGGSRSRPSTSPPPSRFAWPDWACSMPARLLRRRRAGPEGGREGRESWLEATPSRPNNSPVEATKARRAKPHGDGTGPRPVPQPPAAGLRLSQHGKLTFNALTGSFDLTLDEGPGIRLRAGDSTHFWPVVTRSPRSIRCNWLLNRLAPAAGSTSNYAEVQASLAAEHGAANVYLISQPVSRLGHPRTALGRFCQRRASTTGGSVVAESSPSRGGRFNSNTKTWPPGSGSRASRTSGRIPRQSWSS